MILLIDNYDSFTYNLAQYLGELGEQVEVRRNDALTPGDLAELDVKAIVLSPGPCTPNEAGICLDVVRDYAGKIPILGVCLGHQTIAQALGGSVVRADRIMHGKVSPVFHDGRTVFQGLQNPMQATRYHSLIVDSAGLPDSFEISAKTWEDEIMGIRHIEFGEKGVPLEGVQFHPESIATPDGRRLLENFVSSLGEGK